jgi:hypothetical protein
MDRVLFVPVLMKLFYVVVYIFLLFFVDGEGQVFFS